MNKNNPLVSIVVPVYNSSTYLCESLEAISKQTYSNIEIICIDDGSTDDSFSILTRYASKDNRFIIIQQSNQGAASARNHGLNIARGKYLLFLDCDDLFDKNLVEKTVKKAEKFSADIVVYRAASFSDQSTKQVILNDNFSKFTCYTEKTFSVLDIPDDIFNSFMVQAWNKLFRRDFILNHKIKFQNIRRTNDLFFTSQAMVTAERIILLNEVLLYYRVGQSTNLQSGNDKTPLEFHKALVELKEFLVENQIYNLVERSYMKLYMEITLYNYNSAKTSAARDLILNNLRTKVSDEALKKLKTVSFTAYIQWKYLMNGSSRIVSKSLYAVHKIWQYYKMTGLKNTFKKLFHY